MKYKGIIFDLDGVICHTDQYHYFAWKTVADALGIYFDEQINNRLRGVSRLESLEIILKGYGKDITKEEKERLAAEKNKIYLELLQNLSDKDLSDEVKTTLERLKTSGVKLAIGSSSKNAGFILRQLKLADFFDAVSDGNNITNSKPDPEVFLNAAFMLGLKPKDCLVVEDAVAGIEAAGRGGFDSAGLGEALKSGTATYPISSFQELADIIT